jgi:hypothetical protein
MIPFHMKLMRGENNVLVKNKTVFWKRTKQENYGKIKDTCEYKINERKKTYF